MIKGDPVLLLIGMAAAAALTVGYIQTGTPVTVMVDGQTIVARTHRTAVAGLLEELGIALSPADWLSPAPQTILSADLVIRLERARRYIVQVDGRREPIETHAATPAAVLAAIGVTLHERDQVQIDGAPADHVADLMQRDDGRASLAAFTGMSIAAPAAIAARLPQSVVQRPETVSIVVKRAVPVSVVDNGAVVRVMTAARSVGAVLFAEGIYVYTSDIVTPPVESAVTPGLNIDIRRAKTAVVMADGRTFATRTQAATVQALLVAEGMPALNKDFTEPPLETPISDGIRVTLTRVREELLTEAESVPFNTVYEADRNTELDQRRIVTPGRQGVRKRSIRVVYENGQEARRTLDREWIDEEPTTQVIAYGTRVVVRTLNTSDGPIEYWRALRVWATYYTAATSGKAPDHPAYGITRTGIWATKGVIAVDPTVIRLHTPMYVPGYGRGAAEDTGGLVLGMHIDLCFDEDDPNPRHLGWVTAYLLTPVPGDIPYILPDFPKER